MGPYSPDRHQDPLFGRHVAQPSGPRLLREWQDFFRVRRDSAAIRPVPLGGEQHAGLHQLSSYATLAAGNGPDDEKGLRPRRDRVGQRSVRWIEGEILLAGEEPEERSSL